jgi:hypothetical protein
MIKTDIVMTLRSPLAHGTPEVQGEAKRGNITELRRIPFITPYGELIQLPAVSGNSIRCSKRRVQGYKMLQELNDITLPLDAIYFILAGGTTGNTKAKPVGQNVYTELRQTLPFIDLFGGSYKGHFLGGRMGVGFGLPVTKETLPIHSKVMDKLGLNTDPDAYPDLLSLNEAINNNVIMYARHALEGTRGLTDETESNASGQMIYGMQAMPIGTVLISHIVLNEPTASPLTESCYYAFLNTLLDDGFLGAAFAKGCGEFDAMVLVNGTKTEKDEIRERGLPFWESVQSNKENIEQTLLGLDDLLQNEPSDTKKNKQNRKNNGTGDDALMESSTPQ